MPEQDGGGLDTDLALGASYLLREVVGRGAMGEVWRAVDRRTDQTVAAKLLRTEHLSDRNLVSRFIQERSVLTGLRDPHLVAVRDLVVEGDRLAIVMDYVGGGSLRDVTRERRTLPPALAAGVVRDVLLGLGVAHEQRLVHRDIKPDNVLLTPQWEDLAPGSVQLSDFGIARIVGEGESSTTGLLGTPEYMSPEMLTTGGAGPAADVYGVGILLYELLSGRTPFAGPGTDYTVAHRHVTNEVPRVPVPDELAGLLGDMLAKDPRARPSARQASDRVSRLLPGLAGLPALVAQEAPEDFAPARGPVTVVRGMTPAPAPEETAEPVEQVDLADLDLGTPGSATIVRPLQRPAQPRTRPRVEEVQEEHGPWWRDLRVLAAIAGTVLLVIGVVVIVTTGGGLGSGKKSTAGSGSAQATVQDQPLVTGLTLSRSAQYDADSGTVTLTVRFATQNSPLEGPFLVVVPALGRSSSCPATSWQGEVRRNLPTTTGIDTACAWSVDPGTIAKQQSAEVTATVAGLDLGGSETQTRLQDWLQAGADATTKAVSDRQITSSSYPAQRLQGIEVQTPSRVPTGRTLRITLVPVWPDGPDPLDPIYRSPSVDPPTSVLDSVAGGTSGLAFTDGCNGALAVSSDGLTVTTLSASPECVVKAAIGNFTTESSGWTSASREG